MEITVFTLPFVILTFCLIFKSQIFSSSGDFFAPYYTVVNFLTDLFVSFLLSNKRTPIFFINERSKFH